MISLEWPCLKVMCDKFGKKWTKCETWVTFRKIQPDLLVALEFWGLLSVNLIDSGKFEVE